MLLLPTVLIRQLPQHHQQSCKVSRPGLQLPSLQLQATQLSKVLEKLGKLDGATLGVLTVDTRHRDNADQLSQGASGTRLRFWDRGGS